MDQYFVEFVRNTWRIKYDGSYVGIFPTKEAAIRWAVKRAHNAKARGDQASVLSWECRGRLRVEWTNSKEIDRRLPA